MPTKEPINTASLQQFIQQVKGADLSNQKEVRLDINTAKQVTYSLATVFAKKLGTKWDPKKKKWYIFSNSNNKEIILNRWPNI